jgi:uncharacterized protein (TIGR00159 family)
MSQSIVLFFSTIRWQDVVDIVLNSYILFRVYALFRGTQVFRILVGMAFFWLFHRIAISLGLILTSWAMQGIIAVAALIIIIVFRTEIRSVLQAKTLRTLLWGVAQKAEKAPAESVVDALFELASKRIGALVVLPGKENLEELLQSGIPWDGSVSKEMIMSIFWKDNPVHDGAAIITGSRITQVGTILPLSRRDDLPSYYGTRHRAAVGLAGSSDALVVLVSEERGQILTAKGTRIEVVTSKTALLETILNHVGPTESYTDRSPKEKMQLIAASLVSVAFITGIWFSFTRGFESTATLEIPVDYMNRAPEKEILQTSVDQVRITLGGSGTLIRSIRPGQVQVRLDLSRAVTGLNTFVINPEDVILPPGVMLKDISPHTVEVFLDTPMRKEFPVQVDWTGKLAENLVLSEAVVTPDKVTIIAGKQVLDDLSTIYTEKVNLNGIKSSGTMTARLILQPASIKLAQGSRDTVTIKFTTTNRNN